MQRVTISLYRAAELRVLSPQAYDYALSEHQQSMAGDPDLYSDECKSYESLITAIGDLAPVADLAGARALAWFENTVLSPLRIPYTPLCERGLRTRLAKYGTDYRAGKVPPCPMTGFYADAVLLDALHAALLAGRTVSDAVASLAGVLDNMVASVLDYASSAEAFETFADAHGQMFTENGVSVSVNGNSVTF